MPDSLVAASSPAAMLSGATASYAAAASYASSAAVGKHEDTLLPSNNALPLYSAEQKLSLEHSVPATGGDRQIADAQNEYAGDWEVISHAVTKRNQRRNKGKGKGK